MSGGPPWNVIAAASSEEQLALCARLGVRHALLFASSYAEVGPEGLARQQRLVALCRAGGVRLLGVGVSGLADWIQEDLFEEYDDSPEPETDPLTDEELEKAHRSRRWSPGMDVVHTEHGQGWVWGSGARRVTVRFETALTGPGPVRTFWSDDPELSPLRT